MRFKFSQFINVEVIDEMPLLGYDLISIASAKHREKIMLMIAYVLENKLSEYVNEIDGIKIRVTMNKDLRRFDGDFS